MSSPYSASPASSTTKYTAQDLEEVLHDRRIQIKARIQRVEDSAERETVMRAIDELRHLAQEERKMQVARTPSGIDPFEKSKRFQELVFYGASRIRAVVRACDVHIELQGEEQKDWFWKGLCGELVCINNSPQCSLSQHYSQSEVTSVIGQATIMGSPPIIPHIITMVHKNSNGDPPSRKTWSQLRRLVTGDDDDMSQVVENYYQSWWQEVGNEDSMWADDRKVPYYRSPLQAEKYLEIHRAQVCPS